MAHFKLLEPEPDQVLIEQGKGSSSVRKVILNRPGKLNCLTYRMVSQLLSAFHAFEIDPAVKLVILKGKGNAFCAGGDVTKAAALISSGHWSFAAIFYKKQLTLDYFLATYKKPVVAIINGIVMGGGAGITMHGKYRIVTENTVFAMPEASIGLVPDVGASHFLPKLPGFYGEYLALTGARLDGSEMLACGLATHFIPSKDLSLLEVALSELNSPDISTIENLISRFKVEPSLKLDSSFRRLDAINKCFGEQTVEDILTALEKDALIISTGAEDIHNHSWRDKAIKSLKAASPISLKITLKSIRKGRTENLEQCLMREYKIVRHAVRPTFSNDFFEGTRALLFDKDKSPKWDPPKLELITEEMVDQYFRDPDDDDDGHWDTPQSLEYSRSRSHSTTVKAPCRL
ncbi:hypothetical protein Dimus_021890 [Dionaea muscipula]